MGFMAETSNAEKKQAFADRLRSTVDIRIDYLVVNAGMLKYPNVRFLPTYPAVTCS